jgi:hypothetical protein
MASTIPANKQPLDIAYYTELQRRFFETLRFISCHERNFGTYSVVLESLLVDSGSFFDSLSQQWIRDKTALGHQFVQQNSILRFAQKASGQEGFNFGDYRHLLEADFKISTMTVNLNPYEDAYFANPHGYLPDSVSGYDLAPFKEWASGGVSTWWKAFTELKHDRIRNFRSATLGNTVLALAATFIVLTLRNEQNFKSGNVSFEMYELFLPKYWKFNGRLFPGIFTWG